jgi:predicted nuclease with TOPRIM domain
MDAIADVEDELEASNDRIKELEEELSVMAEDRDNFKEVSEQLAEEVKQWEAYAEWIYANYPDAEKTYQALEKLKK